MCKYGGRPQLQHGQGSRWMTTRTNLLPKSLITDFTQLVLNTTFPLTCWSIIALYTSLKISFSQFKVFFFFSQHLFIKHDNMLIIEQYFLSLVFCRLKTELWWECLEISEQTICKGRRRKKSKTNKNSFPPEHIACNPHRIVEIPSWAQVNIQLRIHHNGELWKMKTHFLLHLKTSSKLGIVVKKSVSAHFSFGK